MIAFLVLLGIGGALASVLGLSILSNESAGHTTIFQEIEAIVTLLLGALIVTMASGLAAVLHALHALQESLASTAKQPNFAAREIAAQDAADPEPDEHPEDVLLFDRRRMPLSLRYRDSRGHVTERQVVVHQAFGHAVGGEVPRVTYLRAYCQMRHGIRTFRADHIQRAVNPDTGEVITDLDAYLRSAPTTT